MEGYMNHGIKIPHNKQLGTVDLGTGEFNEIKPTVNNIPEDKSLHKMNNFFKMNVTLINKLKHSGLLTIEEIGVITYMSTVSEWNTKSLKPSNNDTSLRMLAEFFGINKNRVKKVLEKLFKLGVYMQIKIHKEDVIDYWVLNPNISWKGTLSTDSIFEHFRGTAINALLVL